MTAATQKRPELRDALLHLAAIDPLVALDVSCLAEFLLRDGRGDAAVASSGSRAGSVAVVPVHGALMPRGGRSLYGSFTGMDGLRSQIRAHANDPDVSTIVLDIDSPGGAVAGTLETAAEVKAAAGQKPVIAVANTLAASAAYWIGSQASEFVITPGADVGSIGAMILHQDISGAMEQFGVKMTMIRSAQAPQKNEAHPFAPLSDEARAFLQGRADEAGNDFIKAVASGRSVTQAKVKEDFGQGRVYGAREALSRGMVDRIATLDDVIGGLQQKRTSSRRRSALAFE